MARSGCIFGGTGSYKTTQVKWLSHYIAETTGKATLLMSCDGGGWQSCEREVEAGMIRPYRVEPTTLPLSIMQRISKGEWPIDPEETRPEKINLTAVNWDEVGGIAVEGWTSISAMLMRYLPARGINVGGEDRNKPGSNMSFTVPVHVNGEVKNELFGSNTRGDFGFVQNQLYSLVMNFNSLPVKYVLYTALEAKTEDDDRATVFGPAIAGKKATAQCGAWVGDLLHAQDYSTVRTVKVPNPSGKPGEMMDSQVVDLSVRYYFKKHLDAATGIAFPAKTRVVPEGIAELDRLLPGGYFEPTTTWGIDRYLKTVDELGKAAGTADDAMAKWRERMDARIGRGKAASK